MKVILLKNVPNIGLEGDVKEVALGYARNFLFPKKLADVATAEAVKKAEENRAKRKQEALADLSYAEQLAKKMEGLTIEIAAKASEERTLYASVSAAKIVEALKNKGFEVKKENIKTSHIKDLGEHEVVIDLDHGLNARIVLIINPEKK